MSATQEVHNISPHAPVLESENLIQVLKRQASSLQGRSAFTLIADGEGDEAHLTYAALETGARAVAATLQQAGVGVGERALLAYAAGFDFAVAYFGCLYAGVLPVPVAPPDPSRPHRTLPRLRGIIADAEPSVALTTRPFMRLAAECFPHAPELQSLRWLESEQTPAGLAAEWREPHVGAETPAALLYTSGPIRAPRGVVLTHANLLDNMARFSHQCGLTCESTIVTWLPHYSAFGLIFGFLQHIYRGGRSCVMSPISFVKSPFKWLDAITRHRATHTAAPNFAFDHCVREVTPEQRATLDLGCLRVAGNGAEMIHTETLDRFAETFAAQGFRRDAFCPVYGLSEAMVVSCGRAGVAPARVTLELDALEEERRVREADEESSARAARFVSCGAAVEGSTVVVVNPETLRACEADEAGEVWVSNGSIAETYWRQPQESERTLRATLPTADGAKFLRTGDLGFLNNGEIFLTGRWKEILIVRGQNHFPQDIEATVEEHCQGLHAGGCAAFSVTLDGEERPVVVAERDAHAPDAPDDDSLRDDEVMAAIRQALVEYHGLQVHAVLLVRPGTVPHDSVGEVDRRACRASFLARSLEVLAEWVRSSADAGREGASRAGAGMVYERILHASPAERTPLITVYLCEQIGEVISCAPERLDHRQSLLRLGIDSLVTLDLKRRVEVDLRVDVPMAEFLEAASVEELAAHIAARLADGRGAERAQLTPRADGNGGEYPLSYNQQSLWFIHQLVPDSPVYNMAFAVRIRSKVEGGTLRRALQEIINRHPSLRTAYGTTGGQPVQTILEQQEVSFDEWDAAGWHWDDLSRRLVEEAHRPFALESGLLMRASLWQRAGEEFILVLAVHHIAIDFWSLELLISELGLLYPALSEGSPVLLPRAGLQYSDYVYWQSEMLAGAEGEELRSYWEQQLSGELPVLNLPTSRPRPLRQSYRGASHAFSLEADLTAQLKELAQAEDATLYMVLLAAFQTLLYRYTGQDDILVGSPTAGRNRAGLEEIIGYFVNPIVLRADLSGHPSFKDFLGQVRQTVLGALKHQDFPFRLLVERLHPERDASHSPLLQVMFVLEKPYRPEDEGISLLLLGEAGANTTLGGLELESFPLAERSAPFDLLLVMVEVGGELKSSLLYNTDLFDHAAIARMEDHLRTLLRAVVTDTRQSISALPLLTHDERRQLLVEWGTNEARRTADDCLPQLFEAQAERSPGATALASAERRMSYGELNERANRLAHKLRSLGVVADAPVGILLERSIETVVAILAVLKAGGAYLPLDPAYPRERLTFMLADADPTVLLTQRHLLSLLPAQHREVIYVESDWDDAGEESRANPKPAITGANLAYIIYTSGSTGRPKGVMVEHRAVCNLAEAQIRAFGVCPQSKVLQFAPLSFDASVSEIFMALLAGATLYLDTKSALTPQPKNVIELLRERAITTVTLPPSLLAVLPADDLPALRSLVVAGEPCPVEVATRWAHGRRFFNAYGPTEGTVCATISECAGEINSKPAIGRPLANTKVYLLDDNLEPVPAGVAGELYIGGAGVARGYLNRADLTAEKFIPDPFAVEPGARLYKSGDWARHLPDGQIEYIGRIDEQVKVRGFRIELGEIEAALGAHTSVRECAVIARVEEGGEKRLLAYVVPRDAGGADSEELREHLKNSLPAHMIPAACLALEALPLTPSGKIDRKALAERVQSPAGTARAAYVAPRTSMEETLAALCSQVLRVERVGVNDDLFSLGAHSLSLTQIIFNVKDEFGVSLPLQAAFAAPTVAHLALLIVQEQLEQKDAGEIEQLLAHLEHLSQDAAEQLLEGNTAD